MYHKRFQLDQSKLDRLCRKINYKFKSQNLLIQALSHCSSGSVNNERFEFVGDSILGFVIANALFEKFPDRSEGELSRLRAHLVRGEMLGKIALEINLGDYLLLGQGELKSGGFRRESILADALEALFAAIYFDSDYLTCNRVVISLFETRLNDKNLTNNLIDAKTQLQEYLQLRKEQLPKYSLLKIEGEIHDQIFHVSCETESPKQITKASGSSRRKAEQIAAKKMLDILL